MVPHGAPRSGRGRGIHDRPSSRLDYLRKALIRAAQADESWNRKPWPASG